MRNYYTSVGQLCCVLSEEICQLEEQADKLEAQIISLESIEGQLLLLKQINILRHRISVRKTHMSGQQKPIPTPQIIQ